MTTLTATEARKQLYTLLDDVSESHEPIQITGKRHSAVLISESDWKAVQEHSRHANIETLAKHYADTAVEAQGYFKKIMEPVA